MIRAVRSIVVGSRARRSLVAFAGLIPAAVLGLHAAAPDTPARSRPVATLQPASSGCPKRADGTRK